VQQVLPTIGPEEQFQTALPVYDLAVKAGAWGSDVSPEVVGWARVPRRPLDPDMFIAKVSGRSMEPGIVDGAWGLFQSFSTSAQISPTSLDGRRVVVRLASDSDPETGAYTLKRWKVTKLSQGGQVSEVALRPDNRDFEPVILTPESGIDVRVVAEFLETLG
jgi:SOS-response transcriptional repressor LexA